MASILKRIVQHFSASEKRASAGHVFTAAFGKHPGWDDHIDDIGLDTQVLIAVKRALYIRGIGGNVDAGGWEKLERQQQAVPFGHLFVWLMGPDIVVGRLWPSRDGKGRTSYPMVVCVQCSRVPLPWLFEHLLPRLERVETACRATTSAEDVRRIVGDAQKELRQLIQPCEPAAAPAWSPALARVARLPHIAPDRQALHRILYCIDRDIAQERPGGHKRRDAQPVAVRVPLVSPTSPPQFLPWADFLLARFGAETPILSVMPVENAWIDMIIGEPTDAHLFCLRAALAAMPLTTSIPYHIDSGFVARVDQLVDAVLSETEGGPPADRR